jgi:hypothetical protein
MTMRLTIATLFALATIAHGQTICLPVAGQPTRIGPIPQTYGRYSNPRIEHMQPDGWRLYCPSGTEHIKTAHWADTGTACTQVVDAVWTPAELAQQAADAAQAASNAAAQTASNAAAEAIAPRDVQLGKAMLRTYPGGAVELLSGPLILTGTTNGAYEVWVDSDTGLVFADLDHASPRKTKAEKDAQKAARKAKIAAVKAATNDKDKLAALLVLMGLK